MYFHYDYKLDWMTFVCWTEWPLYVGMFSILWLISQQVKTHGRVISFIIVSACKTILFLLEFMLIFIVLQSSMSLWRIFHINTNIAHIHRHAHTLTCTHTQTESLETWWWHKQKIENFVNNFPWVIVEFLLQELSCTIKNNSKTNQEKRDEDKF